MKKERPYGFRKFLNTVHIPNRRDATAQPGQDEVALTDDWHIVFDRNASDLTARAAADLRDYLFVSMDVSMALKKSSPRDPAAEKAENRIVLAVQRPGGPRAVAKSYRLEVRHDEIRLTGADDRGLAQGCYHLEDLMTLRRAPFLPLGSRTRTPLFAPRMVHSGWGLDQYPDPHLRAIAAAGMDAILVFAKDVNTTPTGYLDFNDLVDRAAAFGIDVYFYSYLKSAKHPGEKDAPAYYAQTYGRLFEACPGAKGVVLVGESCEFPSHDRHTTGCPRFMARAQAQNDIFATATREAKPSPGWWPCHDYPQWLALVRDSVRKHNPAADIVFWSYNWGAAPASDRIKLIESLPRDITLLVTFEMFDKIKRPGAVDMLLDYTITYPGPGMYFASEAAAAKKRGLRLYAMCNTGGLTWDFGTIPYLPVPQQWGKRHDALLAARAKWGLSGLMESHHFGFYPSFISELAKWSYWSPRAPAADILRQIAVRDFGVQGAPFAIRAWRDWSDAIDRCPMTNEDQYGPFRVGPAYPMLFHPDITVTFSPQEIPMPSLPWAHFGGRIAKTFYHPFERAEQSPGALRFPVELAALQRALRRWEQGCARMDQAAALAPPNPEASAVKAVALGRYIAHCLRTAIHMKQWWLLNKKLLIEKNPRRANMLLARLTDLARAEMQNARATIPLVESDSRLGWEPSMEYMTDRPHLEWKIRQVKSVLEHEIPTYRKMLAVR